MNKNELRQKLKGLRLRMSEEEMREASRIIADKLLTEIDLRTIKRISLYRSIAILREVDTEPIIKCLREKWPDLELDVADAHNDAPMPAGKFDVIIVPTLGFDKDKYRLGWGGGFYDRFLATQPQALKIGLCFKNCFIEEGLPHEPHDIPLDKIITENS